MAKGKRKFPVDLVGKERDFTVFYCDRSVFDIVITDQGVVEVRYSNPGVWDTHDPVGHLTLPGSGWTRAQEQVWPHQAWHLILDIVVRLPEENKGLCLLTAGKKDRGARRGSQWDVPRLHSYNRLAPYAKQTKVLYDKFPLLWELVRDHATTADDIGGYLVGSLEDLCLRVALHPDERPADKAFVRLARKAPRMLKYEAHEALDVVRRVYSTVPASSYHQLTAARDWRFIHFLGVDLGRCFLADKKAGYRALKDWWLARREFVDGGWQTSANMSQFAQWLRDAWRAGGLGQLPVPLPACVRRCREWHEAEAARPRPEYRHTVAPAAPFLEPAVKEALIDDVVVTWVSNAEELAAEGKAMHHCVGSYSSQCSRSCYIFHLESDEERSTLQISAPNLSIAQHHGVCNAEPSSLHKEVARKFFLQLGGDPEKMFRITWW